MVEWVVSVYDHLIDRGKNCLHLDKLRSVEIQARAAWYKA